MFYVGYQGQFDAYVHSEPKRLKQEYPQINYAVVLAYMPGKQTEYDDYSDRRVLNPSTHTTPSLGAATGCSSNPPMSSPTSPTPGAVLRNMQKSPSVKRNT